MAASYGDRDELFTQILNSLVITELLVISMNYTCKPFRPQKNLQCCFSSLRTQMSSFLLIPNKQLCSKTERN